MRCYCCNNLLTPVEAVRKFKESDTSPGDYTDMCDKCLNEIVDDYDLEIVDGVAPEDEELFDDDGNPVEDY